MYKMLEKIGAHLRGDIQLSRTSKIFEIHNEKVEKNIDFCETVTPKCEILENPTFHDFTVAYPIENHGNILNVMIFQILPDLHFSVRLLHKNLYFSLLFHYGFQKFWMFWKAEYLLSQMSSNLF